MVGRDEKPKVCGNALVDRMVTSAAGLAEVSTTFPL